MSIASIVTRGYGSFGSIAEVVTRGYFAEEVVVEVVSSRPGGSSGRRRRKWKTTEEIVRELRAEREFKFIPAPEVEITKIEIDYDLISRRVLERLFEAQRQLKAKRRKKMAASMMLLDS